ncbi:MAG: ABC transporter [Peptococcaceae bacterium BRH_c4a]|nr:MAG: ABC transporter [Peptococcaceae bacterium BRH_c4a]
MKDRQTLAWLYQNSKTQLLPMIALIVGYGLFAGCGVLFALASRGVIDGAVAGEKHILMTQGLYLFSVIVLQLVLRIACGKLEVRIQGRLEMGYKTKLLGKILQKDYAGTTGYHSGELLNRLTSDITVVSEGVTTILPNITGLLTKLLSALAVLCVFDPSFALIFAIGGLLLFFTTKFFRGRLKYLHKNMQEKDGVVRSFIQEILESMLVVKTFGVEREINDKSAGLQQEHYKVKVKRNTVSILANSGFSFVFSIGYLYALVWSSFGLIAKTISFGTLTAILQLVGQVQSPFAGLSGLLPKAYGIIASAERMMELENLPDELEINRQDMNLSALYKAMQSIRFKDVSFRYDRTMVLNQVDLTIEKGDFTVISGISGIGKSTLIKLLLGVFAPTGGSIGIQLDDGERIPVDRHTRKLFAYVPQENLLLSGTIRDSITFVNANLTDEEIMAAAQVSCAAEFISALPRGLDTVIGEKGQGLSEGQVQRLVIARAILSGSPILLLDEATSALDEATEKRLLNNIRRMTNKTCIIISHKKAAFSVCSKEIRIENSTIKTMKRSNRHAYHTA